MSTGAGVGIEKGALWVILAPGPGGNRCGQFLGRGASRAPGASAAYRGHSAARSAGDG